ncbi:uncharacterized protein M421DRAFT_75631 [Didymella exigua CBS 183.55]|uniref:Uncharacterized protein n=1 Tax=Didymella exigua CBS 183.55 TaxID=1150837 RepID=A0A6A5R5H6_9PLEO|nr:uncharacterized protein M421DRAFT_75631 [Didymella exigua CBS 183.55]KAF1923375.1 hypothetical protein M421DRAFT_75631 [Didymella exigua CBS 183.55]
MCNGNSSRISQGGSIAVLRRTQHLRRSNTDDMMLFFHNQMCAPGTSVEFHGWDDDAQREKHWVVIHRDGDLSGSASPVQTPPFYSFSLESSEASTMHLPQKLDLGVGDAGIIGRRVSVMTGSMKGPLTVAEGIIGWN